MSGRQAVGTPETCTVRSRRRRGKGLQLCFGVSLTQGPGKSRIPRFAAASGFGSYQVRTETFQGRGAHWSGCQRHSLAGGPAPRRRFTLPTSSEYYFDSDVRGQANRLSEESDFDARKAMTVQPALV